METQNKDQSPHTEQGRVDGWVKQPETFQPPKDNVDLF